MRRSLILLVYGLAYIKEVCGGPPYWALMELVIIICSCWTNREVKEMNCCVWFFYNTTFPLSSAFTAEVLLDSTISQAFIWSFKESISCSHSSAFIRNLFSFPSPPQQPHSYTTIMANITSRSYSCSNRSEARVELSNKGFSLMMIPPLVDSTSCLRMLCVMTEPWSCSWMIWMNANERSCVSIAWKRRFRCNFL